MSGRLAWTRLKASAVPGMAWLTTIAFILGSSDMATTLEMKVSCWDMKSSGYVMCWTIPPLFTDPYSLMRASAPRRSSSDWDTVPVQMPTWNLASAMAGLPARNSATGTKAVAT